MKIINKLSLRYLKNNKRKVIVIILSIILSTTLLVSISLGASTIRGYNVKSALSYSGSHHAIFKNLDYKVYENLKEDNKIDNIIVMQDINNISSSQIKDDIKENFILTIKSLNKNIEDYITLKKGRYPQNNKEIIISDSLSYTINYDIDNEISGLKIVGIYNSNKLDLDEYHTNHLANTQTFTPIAITKDTIKENLNISYIVTFKKSINIYNQIYKKAEELGLTYTVDEKDNRYYEKMEENGVLLQALGEYPNMKTQIGMYSMLLVILLAISMFCIMTIKNSFSISLSERKKYFGSLRSLGASKKQIFKMVLFETLILSIISIPIGIILGISFTNLIIFIVNNIMKDLITNDFKLIIYPIYLIISFIFIIITIIFASITPARKSSEISPMEVIKENKTYSVIKSKEKYPIIKKIFGIEGELAYKTIKRNNSKFSVTVNSLIISVILFITLSAFTNFLLSQNTYDSNSSYDITLKLEDPSEKNDIIEKIKNIKAIDEFNIESNTFLKYKTNNNTLTNETKNNQNITSYSSIDIIGLDEDNYNDLKKKIGLKEDKIILYNVVYDYTEKNEKYPYYNWFNNNLKEIEICSVYEDNSNNISIERSCYYNYNNLYLINDMIIEDHNYSPIIIMSMKDYNNFIDEYMKQNEESWKIDVAKHISIGINSKKYKEVDSELKKIFNEYSALNLEGWYYNYPLDNEEEYTQISAIRFVINSAMIFIVIISITSIINTMSTNLSLRETEFSVLRSIGLSKKGLNKMLFLESIFLGIKTVIYGIPSATFFVLLEMYFAKIMSGDVFAFPTNAYIISFIGIFIIVFIMNIYSSNKIKNKNIIDSIRKQSI